MNAIDQGCIDIWIDEIVPCLKDTVTGDIKETVVFKIESRTYLKNGGITPAIFLTIPSENLPSYPALHSLCRATPE